MVVQNISYNKKETDLTFTIKKDDLIKTKKLLKIIIKLNLRNLIIDQMYLKFL